MVRLTTFLFFLCGLFSQKYINTDYNYEIKPPVKWNIIIAKNQPFDVIFSPNNFGKDENITVKTLGRGLQNNFYLEKENIIKSLKSSLPRFELISTSQVSVKSSSNDLFLEGKYQLKNKVSYFAQFIFTNSNISYSTSITGPYKKKKVLRAFFKNVMLSFKGLDQGQK